MKCNRIIASLLIVCSCTTMLIAPSYAYTKPTTANAYVPQSGSIQYKQGGVILDYTNSAQGYIMISYNGRNDKTKVQIAKNGVTYTYDLNNNGSYSIFPLSEGDGNYDIKVYEHVVGNQYSIALSKTISATLANGQIPFLYPNQYVNFNNDSQVAQIASQITATDTDQFAVVQHVFDYVISNITYDNAKAASVQSGYIPDVDSILASHTGICFDYAAVMAAMLRSQNIPTKLVIGYTGSAYHAWISVYLDGQGWVENVIYFDGVNWTLMDPTFASSNNKNAEIMAFMANSANYQSKFSY